MILAQTLQGNYKANRRFEALRTQEKKGKLESKLKKANKVGNHLEN